VRAQNITALRLAIAVPALALAGAYVSQYGFGLYPCEMCWWQRWPHFIALGFALLAAQLAPLQKPLLWLAALALAVTGAIGVFHAGVEYHWWEGLTTCARMDSGGGNALDAILATPVIRCDEAAFRFLTISMAGWNALISLGSAVLISALLLRKEHRR
jgi:disulfide bond formation protein DsbB